MIIMMEKNWEIIEPSDFLVENDYYLISGKKYWRITQVKNIINQPGLNEWRAKSDYNDAKKYLNERRQFGTDIHKLFEKKLHSEVINIDNYHDDELKNDLIAFDEFVKDCELNAEATEQHLWSEYSLVAGTADYIGNYKSCSKYLRKIGRGKNKKPVDSKFNKTSKVIGDWKTSAYIYEDYWLQLSAYVFMFKEKTGVQLDGAFIAQFKDGKVLVEEKTYDELCKYFAVFEHCVPLFIYQSLGIDSEELETYLWRNII